VQVALRLKARLPIAALTGSLLSARMVGAQPVVNAAGTRVPIASAAGAAVV
jgi:hypothetical protein